MRLRDIFGRVRGRIDRAKASVRSQKMSAQDIVRSFVDSFSDERIEKAFELARQRLAPSIEHLPVDFQLRRSYLPRRIYEKTFPVSHVQRITYKYEREFLDDYMPISNDTYVGRGSYKFVYLLPWSMVVKVGRSVLPSDPLFGSLYREVSKNQERYLSSDERSLLDFYLRKRNRSKERLRLKFHRLGLERLHYMKVKEGLPDLVLPTRFFMGMRYRRRPFGGYSETLTPMDSQIMLVGKHMKEFASAGKPAKQNVLMKRFFPRYDFVFNSGRFGKIKKKVVIKIREDFRRLIRFTEELAQQEKLILDIHSENIIITLPEFELKVFDFHLFDEHLYEHGGTAYSEKELIDVIERFVDSLELVD